LITSQIINENSNNKHLPYYTLH